MIAGLGLLASSSIRAADDDAVAKRQAELERAKAEITQLHEQLQQGQAAPANRSEVAVAASPAIVATNAAASGDGPSAGAVENPAVPSAPVIVDGPASASPTATSSETGQLEGIVVSTRNRLLSLQDEPVSESVVTGEELERLGAYDLGSLTRRAADVTWNIGNQRTMSVSIRGVGKLGQTEAQDPSVGITVDGVSYAYNPLASAYDFTDVDQVQVARGPQGTLGGKNANLGVINITTKRPSFTPSVDYEVTLGQWQSVEARAAIGGPVVDGLLAWRGTLSVNHGQGNIKNIYNPDETFTNTDRASGKVQFLLTPTADFSARVSVDLEPRGGETDNGRTFNTPTPNVYANGQVNPLSTDPSTRLKRSWFTQTGYSLSSFYSTSYVDYNAQQPLVTGGEGASAELDWNLGKYTLSSISAYRDYHFDAQNDEGTPFDIQRNSGGYVLDYRQSSEELRLSSTVGDLLDYQAGIFLMSTATQTDYQYRYGADAGAWFANTAQYNALDATAAGRGLLVNSLDGLGKDIYQNIYNRSEALYAQANWHLSQPLTLTTGLRLSHEERANNATSTLVTSNGFGGNLNPVTVNNVPLGYSANAAAQYYFGTASYSALTAAQQTQLADALAIRKAQIGVLWAPVNAQALSENLPSWVISPSYKINSEETAYISWQHGAKAGISQVTNGVNTPALPEKTNAFELGLKSSLLNKELTVNADLFVQNITDYQQAVEIYDAYTTALNNNGLLYYASATGNAPKVRTEGLEIDSSYTGIRHTSIRFDGALIRAYYREFPNSPQPVEDGNLKTPYRDVSGKELPGAAHLTANLGIDSWTPLPRDLQLHGSANVAYESRSNSDTALSAYAWTPANTLTDFAIGVRTAKPAFDVSLLVKNIFNDTAHLTQTWNVYTPAVPRWIGVMFTGKI